MSPELLVVGACLAWPRDEARAGELQSLTAGQIDWDRLLRLAERHRVVGLVSHALSEAGVRVPGTAGAELKQRAQTIVIQELALAAEVSRIDQALAALGARPTVLKGLSASAQGYQRIGLRQNRDIDLLVAPNQIGRATRWLLADGFDQIEPIDRLNDAGLAEWMRSHKDLVYLHPRRKTIVEVHWRLFDNVEFEKPIVILDPIEIKLPTGQVVLGLPMETALAYMCAHGAQHAWSRLKWLADVGAFCSVLGSKRVAELYGEWKAAGVGLAPGQALLVADRLSIFGAPEKVKLDGRRSWRLRTVRDVALRAIAADEVVELEDQAFGSLFKTLSHYLLRGGLGYWLTQARLDFTEVPKTYSSRWVRRLGPLAKLPLWFYVRLKRRPQPARKARKPLQTPRKG
jgi:hypothetical protein